MAMSHKGKKILVYHNITPAQFFLPGRPEQAAMVDEARAALSVLAESFPHAVSDSLYSAKELEACGFRKSEALAIPYIVGDARPNLEVAMELRKGWKNILFVGRFVANKAQHDLVRAFDKLLRCAPDTRLILAGRIDADSLYSMKVFDEIAARNLWSRVVIIHSPSSNELATLYAASDLFWSMSEHEGFCVPVVEAMWNDVPVLAYGSSALPDTMGESGVLFDSKEDLDEIASAAQLILSDLAVREAVLKSQRERRAAFAPDVVGSSLLKLVSSVVEF
jgi:glycosyltransferase involved in cell wall biosynthesis